jgi:hypothetical protein
VILKSIEQMIEAEKRPAINTRKNKNAFLSDVDLNASTTFPGTKENINKLKIFCIIR